MIEAYPVFRKLRIVGFSTSFDTATYVLLSGMVVE